MTKEFNYEKGLNRIAIKLDNTRGKEAATTNSNFTYKLLTSILKDIMELKNEKRI